MVVDEALKIQYEKSFLKNRPQISEEEAKARNNNVNSLHVISDKELFSVKLATNEGEYLFHINPVAARALALLLFKGINLLGWAEIDISESGGDVTEH